MFNACKKETATPELHTDSITDIDGNIYQTVKIGNQWWMAENLHVKRYNNGDSIIYIHSGDTAKWNKTISGAYTDGKTGLFYNGYIINDVRDLAPTGWHIPNDDEWKQLEIYLGMNRDTANKVNWRGNKEGNKLKKQRKADKNIIWYEEEAVNKFEVWGNNESGFSALPGGFINFDGKRIETDAMTLGFWWSSTQIENQLWYRYLDYSKTNVFRYYGPKTYGFNVRCVKN